jgi:hypothetical protein
MNVSHDILIVFYYKVIRPTTSINSFFVSIKSFSLSSVVFVVCLLVIHFIFSSLCTVLTLTFQKIKIRFKSYLSEFGIDVFSIDGKVLYCKYCGFIVECELQFNVTQRLNYLYIFYINHFNKNIRAYIYYIL